MAEVSLLCNLPPVWKARLLISVVLPDCLGPVTEITGYFPAMFTSSLAKVLAIILAVYTIFGQM